MFHSFFHFNMYLVYELIYLYFPSRPVENVVITTKGLQDRNNLLLDGRTVENKGKLIVTEIFPSVQKHDI